MNDRPELTGLPELEAALRDLGAAVAWPATPDLATAVSGTLRASPPLRPADGVRVRRLIRRSLPRALLLAAAIALLLAGAALGIRFGLDLLRIEFGPPSATPGPTAGAGSAASPSVSPGAPLGAGLGLGASTTLSEAAAEADFPILVPAELGSPDAVFRGTAAQRGQIALVYAPRDGLPASELLRDAGLLVTQALGRPDAGLVNKLVDSGRGSVTLVDVGEHEGYWFHGEPHWFWYMRPDGSIIEESRRFVGNTLVWQDGDVLYRIEGQIDLGRAQEIARSMGPPTPP